MHRNGNTNVWFVGLDTVCTSWIRCDGIFGWTIRNRLNWLPLWNRAKRIVISTILQNHSAIYNFLRWKAVPAVFPRIFEFSICLLIPHKIPRRILMVFCSFQVISKLAANYSDLALYHFVSTLNFRRSQNRKWSVYSMTLMMMIWKWNHLPLDLLVHVLIPHILPIPPKHGIPQKEDPIIPAVKWLHQTVVLGGDVADV